MSEGRIVGHASDVNRNEAGAAVSLGAADWLILAAAPTFAVMALLTGFDGAAGQTHSSQLGGMVPMYLLMSAFHAPPWLKLISKRRGDTRRS